MKHGRLGLWCGCIPMPDLANLLKHALTVVEVVLIFNLMIFIHELGHYWAGKWRGLKIDRFQIWFGKPIWKKEINGVQWGLGWIPAGGFVSLPQMAPMESIEGGVDNDEFKNLPPISPLDKIIVAFAGPLFSFLLALTAAFGVWIAGKPSDVIRSTVVGSVMKGYPADGKLLPGDQILAINGNKVDAYDGTLDSVRMQIITSEGNEIEFTVKRPGIEQPIAVKTGFKISDSRWWQRSSTREVGLLPKGNGVVINQIFGVNAPAEVAGLKVGDRILAINDTKIESTVAAINLLKDNGEKPVMVRYSRDGQENQVTVSPKIPLQPKDSSRAMIGVGFDDDVPVESGWVNPKPWEQVRETVRMMATTIHSLISRSSSIGIDQLSGPIGIAKLKFQVLLLDHPFQRMLSILVMLNVNLAIMNLLPLPVLDGGHIVLAILEKLAGRPVQARILGTIQTAFALLLFSVMLYVTSKDVFGEFGRGAGSSSQQYVFPKQ